MIICGCYGFGKRESDLLFPFSRLVFLSKEMSGDSLVRNIGLEELAEWLESLGLVPADGESSDRPIQKRLKDGILLCQLINRIKPGSVDEVRHSWNGQGSVERVK